MNRKNENHGATGRNDDLVNRDGSETRNGPGDAPTRSSYSTRVDNVNERSARSKVLSSTTGYLHMGWASARCLWYRYCNSDYNSTTDTEQETLQFVGERLKSLARFWTIVVGISVVFLWAAFGCFHELFFVGAVAPPDTYAKDVNRYLTMVPPHVVVTNKAKMFRYQPTAEERFLWKKAKRIATFKI